MQTLRVGCAAVVVRLGEDAGGSNALVGHVARTFAPGDDVAVRARPGRRPQVLASRRLYGSGSGSRGAVAAVVGDRPVGIDVEELRTVREVGGVAASLDGIAPPWPASGPHEDAVVRWTRYEAVVKALGVGLVVPPRAVRIRRDGSVAIRGAPLPLRVETWLAATATARATHAVSVATRPGTTLRHLPPPAVPGPWQPATPVRTPHGVTPLTRKDRDMTTQTIDKEELRALIADTIEVDPADLGDDASFMDDFGVDSLMALEILVVLQKRYGVKLDESRLAEVTSLNGAYSLMVEAVGP